MDELAEDHGFDRLPIFLILVFLYTTNAFATTFGPINVSDQIRKSQYFIHGKITEGPWAEMERQLGRPFTHWKLQIIEQFTGNSLGEEITIRQPGGEINGMGYHVAGSANFTVNEEVFVTVRDTDESGIKDVVGLSSGKYRVEKSGGTEKIQNGIGFAVQLSGKTLTTKEFAQLARRIANGTENESEKKIILNEHFEQNHDPVLDAKIREALEEKSSNTSNSTEAKSSSIPSKENHQEAAPKSEESNDSGNWKLPMILALFAFLAGAAIILRRK